MTASDRTPILSLTHTTRVRKGSNTPSMSRALHMMGPRDQKLSIQPMSCFHDTSWRPCRILDFFQRELYIFPNVRKDYIVLYGSILAFVNSWKLIWRFPEMGVPLDHPFQEDVPIINHHLGYSCFRKPPYVSVGGLSSIHSQGFMDPEGFPSLDR